MTMRVFCHILLGEVEPYDVRIDGIAEVLVREDLAKRDNVSVWKMGGNFGYNFGR
ncbi:hypothetical protein AGABI2DRAFT_139190 [Agaricus bisporus var. bisporus H97]|uniref:hypothetical protein n=1 Tax=Agaricus bisporus var. bisporus (strain H97 / ATCC MYA-4626 / FGSC 10389) TaxID=936046 RepID=UPI00029F6FE5|nr:hypothetical protein AGABI2DRAFT_139190 [Agaricus bisporus var. bisporus H97]EKV42752.1 hypothetical protein AGABI2DRAFT_139190 [Agaricus bisporus var. bisporus H97]